MRKFYFAGNWKMHKTPNEAREFAVDFAAQMGDCQHKLMIAPSFVAIPALSDALKQTGVLVGAQNCAAEVHGAFTGEVSAPMLASSGTDVVIVGHSERRTLFGEDDKLINTKVLRVLEHGMEVILCVGESLEEREAGKAMTVVLGQIEAGLQGIAAVDMRRITIAYEPVWA
ncbi:MAG: triosephosphate isomerase, partial [Spirochaetaceae bacterium]